MNTSGSFAAGVLPAIICLCIYILFSWLFWKQHVVHQEGILLNPWATLILLLFCILSACYVVSISHPYIAIAFLAISAKATSPLFLTGGLNLIRFLNTFDIKRTDLNKEFEQVDRYLRKENHVAAYSHLKTLHEKHPFNDLILEKILQSNIEGLLPKDKVAYITSYLNISKNRPFCEELLAQIKKEDPVLFMRAELAFSRNKNFFEEE